MMNKFKKFLKSNFGSPSIEAVLVILIISLPVVFVFSRFVSESNSAVSFNSNGVLENSNKSWCYKTYGPGHEWTGTYINPKDLAAPLKEYKTFEEGFLPRCYGIDYTGENVEEPEVDEVENFRVTFYKCDGITPIVLDNGETFAVVRKGGSVTPPVGSKATTSSATFKKWTTNLTNITESKEVFPECRKINIKVTLIDANRISHEITVPYGEDLDLSVYSSYIQITNDSWKSVVWTMNEAEIPGNIIYNVTDALTITAKIEYVKHTVTFKNYDNSTISTQEVIHGQAAVEPNTPVRTGWEFKGWDTSFNSVKSDLTVKATFENVTMYNVKCLNANGSVISSTDYKYGSFPACSAPVVAGKKFDHWEPELQQVTKSASYKAVYVDVNYTIKFVNDNLAVLKTQVVPEGTMPTAPATPTHSQNGVGGVTYTFTGWNSPIVAANGDKTYQATYQKNYTRYTITYNLNGDSYHGATNNANNPDEYSYLSTTIVLRNPSREAYNFAGWYSDSALTKQVTEIPSGSTGNKTFYAKWTPINYSISYVLNGDSTYPASNNSSNPSSYNTTQSVTLATPSRTDHTFLGWYSDSSLTTKVTSISKGSMGNKTFYASWKINKVTIKFMSEDGSKVLKQEDIIIGNTITPPSPTRSYSTLQGWSETKGSSTASIGTGAYTVSSAKTFYPVFSYYRIYAYRTVNYSGGYTDGTSTKFFKQTSSRTECTKYTSQCTGYVNASCTCCHSYNKCSGYYGSTAGCNGGGICDGNGTCQYVGSSCSPRSWVGSTDCLGRCGSTCAGYKDVCSSSKTINTYRLPSSYGSWTYEGTTTRSHSNDTATKQYGYSDNGAASWTPFYSD